MLIENKTVDAQAEDQVQGNEVDKQVEVKDEKVFKQEDVNNIVAKETKSAQERILKDLGIDNFENAKDGLAKFKAWQEEQKTEEQKQKEAYDLLVKENKSYKADKELLTAKLEALKLGVNADSLDDVIVLANGKVDENTNITQAIESVLEKYPQFKGIQKAPEIEKQSKPKFINPKNNTNDKKADDAFEKAMEKYRKK